MTKKTPQKAKFLTHLITEAVDDNLNRLTEPLIFRSAWLKRYITAKTGFVTDFCSVPRIPFLFAWLGNRFKKTGTIHDKTYRDARLPKWICDILIIELSRSEGATWREALSLWLGVAVLGPVWYRLRGEKSPYGGNGID